MFSNNIQIKKISNSKSLTPNFNSNNQPESSPFLLNSSSPKNQLQNCIYDEGYTSSFGASSTNSLSRISDKAIQQSHSLFGKKNVDSDYQNLFNKAGINFNQNDKQPTFSKFKQASPITNFNNTFNAQSNITNYDSDFCSNRACHCRNNANHYNLIDKKNNCPKNFVENKFNQIANGDNYSFEYKKQNSLIKNNFKNTSISQTPLINANSSNLVKIDNINKSNIDKISLIKCLGCTHLKNQLKNKVQELNQFRSIMINNEIAIMLVNESKIKEQELFWKSKLEDQVKSSFNKEQNLLQQIVELQSVYDNLRTELDKTKKGYTKLESDTCKIAESNKKLNELREECLKDCFSLKKELDIKNFEINKIHLEKQKLEFEDMEILHSDQEPNVELYFSNYYSNENLHNKNSQPKFSEYNDIHILNRRLSHKCSQLILMKKKYEFIMDCLISERKCWTEEKIKVIEYQKQIQQQYLDLKGKNKQLELDLQHFNYQLNIKSGEATEEISFC